MKSFRTSLSLLFVCLTLSAGIALAQPLVRLRIATSVDWAIDPRSVALGEATVALSGSGDAFASNPAGIAGRRDIWAEYARRSWFLDSDDMQYRSWSAGFATPAGVFMLSYRRNDMGDLLLVSGASPEPTGSIRWYDHTAGLAWGYALGDAIQVGAAVKASREVHAVQWGTVTPPAGLLLPETTIPVLFDLGIICNTGVLSEGDNLAIGASLQNFGSPERVSYQGYSGPILYNPATGQRAPAATISYIQPLPRMLRVGLSYRFRVRAPEAPGELEPLEITAAGEYRDILNARMGEPTTYWGMGLEVTAFEFVTGRVGGLAVPFDGVYGKANTLMARWGLGVQLPLARIASTLPRLTLVGSYAWQPLQELGGVTEYPTIRAFSVGIRYEPGI